jgi:hypothetical protein
MVGEIVLFIVAALYMLVAIYYFSAGMVFSTLLFKLGSLFCSQNVLSVNISECLKKMGDELLPEADPVLSSMVKNNITKGYIILVIGIILAAIAATLPIYPFIGLMGVAFFSVLEVILGIVFYLPRDKQIVPPGKSGITHIILHSIIGLVTTAAFFAALYNWPF